VWKCGSVEVWGMWKFNMEVKIILTIAG